MNPGKIITSLRDVVKSSLCPGHKCPGYYRSSLWGEKNDHATF
jgi:hypothetical protein